MDISGTNLLATHEMELRQELEDVLRHEEILWKQKAKCDWLHLRDHNTKFFHTHALQRRKNNRITVIQNSSREWTFDQKAIELKATNFYHNLYGKELEPMRILPPNKFPKLNFIDLDFLGKEVTDEEIKIALF